MPINKGTKQNINDLTLLPLWENPKPSQQISPQTRTKQKQYPAPLRHGLIVTLSGIILFTLIFLSSINNTLEAAENKTFLAESCMKLGTTSLSIPRQIPEPEPERFDTPAPTEETVAQTFSIPQVNSAQKTYMSYKAITNQSSKQWKLQQEAITDEYGFRRYEGCYMVALGTYYTGQECGKKFKITLDTGVSFNVITGDVKSDKHTDELHQHRNGNIVEFIVDTNNIPSKCKTTGDMSYANDNMFQGKISKIELLK